METALRGTCSSKSRQSKGEPSKTGSQVQAGKSPHFQEVEKTMPIADEKARTSSKQLRFPSLSKLGRAHTFSFGRKRDKDNEKRAGGKSSKAKEKAMDKDFDERAFKESTGRKSHESQKFDAKRYEAHSAKTYGKPTLRDNQYMKEHDYTRATSASRHHEISRSRSCDSRSGIGGKENRSVELPISSSKYMTGKERRDPRRKDCKRKEAPIDRGLDHNNIPLWLQNPPKILIQDFSSDYADETTFDQEYFDLVQWAFRILEKQCNYQMHTKYLDGEPTLLGNAQKNPLKVITTETASVGSTLDYILHPISTGAANVMQTGAKFADFTSRVFRGINFDSIIRKRNEPETPNKYDTE